MTKRRGPRPHEDTRALITDAARREFADKGYAGASLRAIARGAGVDPALVHHYFDGKPALFAQALEETFAEGSEQLYSQVLNGPREECGRRLVESFLQNWNSEEGIDRFGMLIRSVSSDEGLAATHHLLADKTFANLARELGSDRPELRGALVASQLIGLSLLRNVIKEPSLSTVHDSELSRVLAPMIQHLLVEPLD